LIVFLPSLHPLLSLAGALNIILILANVADLVAYGSQQLSQILGAEL